MKKAIMILLAILLFYNCATPVKGVFNPNDLPEEDLILLEINSSIVLYEVNNSKLQPPLISPMNPYVIKVSAGNNIFTVSYLSGTVHSAAPGMVSSILEAGNQYLLTVKINDNKTFKTISYHIYKYNDNKQGEEIISFSEPYKPIAKFNEIPADKLPGNDESLITIQRDLSVTAITENMIIWIDDIEVAKDIKIGTITYIVVLKGEHKIQVGTSRADKGNVVNLTTAEKEEIVFSVKPAGLGGIYGSFFNLEEIGRRSLSK